MSNLRMDFKETNTNQNKTRHIRSGKKWENVYEPKDFAPGWANAICIALAVLVSYFTAPLLDFSDNDLSEHLILFAAATAFFLYFAYDIFKYSTNRKTIRLIKSTVKKTGRNLTFSEAEKNL